MSRLDELKKLIVTFEKTQQRFAKHGASDTEPDAVFQVLLVRAAKGKAPAVPADPDGWELYSDKQGSKAAAVALGEAAKECVDFISKTVVTDLAVIVTYLKDYCWRVGW